MTHNRYDQASRYVAKRDAAGFLVWVLMLQGADVRFRGWLDTRTLPFPGDPERTCDTVAWLGDDWALAVEFCLEPDSTFFGRLLVYLGQLWLEQRPSHERGRRFQVGAVVINLTGRGATSQDMQLPGTAIRTQLQVLERNLADQDAAATLAGIAAGTLGRCVLPWVPLMRGGDEPAIMAQWRELAGLEPDSRRRSDYAGLALVLSEAAGRRAAWKVALEGWNMIESQQVLEWMAEGEAKGKAEGEAKGKAEGEAKGKAESLLRVLAVRFPPGPPAELIAQIRATTDLDELTRWLDAAVTAASLDAFRQAMGS